MNFPTLGARALWYVAPREALIQPTPLGDLAIGHCRVRTLYSAISRGTESLVYQGQIPKSEYQRMASPLMLGQFPYPVAFGYCNVGQVIQGPDDWLGKIVFSLAPHQTVFDAAPSMLTQLPKGLEPRRAVLAANMETALNAVWMGKPGPADRIAIVGAGVVGLLVAHLCRHLPASQLVVIDPAPERHETCQRLGLPCLAEPGEHNNFDLVFHASGHPSGLQAALAMAGNEASVVELSWYGNRAVTVELGAGFHSQQLRLQSCQVGHVEPSHSPRWSYQRRLKAALELLLDDRVEMLLEPDIAFDVLPDHLEQIFQQRPARLCQVIAYSQGD